MLIDRDEMKIRRRLEWLEWLTLQLKLRIAFTATYGSSQ